MSASKTPEEPDVRLIDRKEAFDRCRGLSLALQDLTDQENDAIAIIAMANLMQFIVTRGTNPQSLFALGIARLMLDLPKVAEIAECYHKKWTDDGGNKPALEFAFSRALRLADQGDLDKLINKKSAVAEGGGKKVHH